MRFAENTIQAARGRIEMAFGPDNRKGAKIFAESGPG